MKSDTQLQQDVIAELGWDPAVQATHIGVEVSDGVVTLSGQVESYAEKWHAERAALRVSGVMATSVDIEVRLPGPNQRSDADISRTVANMLQLMADSHAHNVQVQVEQGWVTLLGSVEWDFQRQALLQPVRHMMGVKGVSSLIRLEPAVDRHLVQEEIESALRRRAITDSQSITVTPSRPR